MWVAASSMASSQLMTSHLFSPRSPARRSGCSTRRGLYMVFSWFRPLMHSEPRLTGASGSPSSLTTTPSFKYAMAGHIWMQPWHEVFILTRPSVLLGTVSPCGSPASCMQPASEAPMPAATAASADAFTKLRRVNVVFDMFPLFPFRLFAGAPARGASGHAALRAAGTGKAPSPTSPETPSPPRSIPISPSKPERLRARACPRTRSAAWFRARRR